jgi:hypothetical protein
MRAVLMAVLISTPALLLPVVSTESQQAVVLLSIFGAALTFFEYGSAAPGLVEFRDAPPYNRIRFTALFVIIFLVSVILSGVKTAGPLSELIRASGALVGHLLDFPGSPVRLMLGTLPADSDPEQIARLRSAAGLSYLLSLLVMGGFALLLRLQAWPGRERAFNAWINLPTFDPCAGGDVVHRLVRDGRANIVLGLLLPFLVPALMRAASLQLDVAARGSAQTLIWMVAAWAFLPASLIMRGAAMGRIAHLIRDKRRATFAAAKDEFFQPV